MSNVFSEVGRLVVAPEATPGTDAVAAILTTSTMDILYQAAEEADIKPGLSPLLRKRVIGTAERVAHSVFKENATLKVRVPFGTSVAAAVGGETPPFAPLLQACGFEETINAGTGSEYDLVTKNPPSLTAYLWRRNVSDDKWRLWRITGARGLPTFKFEVGKEAFIEFELTGQYVDQVSDAAEYFDPSTFAIQYLADGSTPVTARTSGTEEWAAQAGAICEAMTYTFGGTALDISALELKAGRNIRAKKVMTGSSATQLVELVPGDGPGGSFDLMDGGTQADTVRDAITNETEGALVMVLTKGSRTNTISAPKMQLLPWERGDDGGVQKYAVPFGLNRNFSGLTGDNSLKLAFT